ncbi:hypothetical protein [Xanthobacter sediminis]
MPWRGKVSAYLVVPFALAADGLWAKQTETVCFDHDLAIEIAQTETQFASGVGIYPLDLDGRCLTRSPIAWYGSFEPPAETRDRTAVSRIRAMFAEHITDAVPDTGHMTLHLH